MNDGEDVRQRADTRMAMAISALMMAHQIAGKATRDGIFLSQFRISALPTMVAVAAVTAVLISIVRGRMLVRVGPFRITAVSFAVSGVLQGAEWLLLGFYPRIAACVIYLHVVAFGAVLMSGFWSVMNESFDPRSAKSVFGRISGIGTLGGLCGGLLADRVAAWVSTSAVVLVLGLLHLLCAVLLWHAFPPRASARRTIAESRQSSVVNAVKQYPFLLTLAGVVLVSSVGTALLDFVFKAQAAHTIGPGAPLLQFFGLYYTVTSLLTFLAQTSVVRFFLGHAGLAACAGALPGTIALGSLIAVLLPGFYILSGVRAIEILIRGSLFRSAYELFFTAVPPAEKRAVKSVLDVGIDRMGDAIGAGGLTLLMWVAPGRYGVILSVAAGCTALALILAMRLQKGYLHALEKSLVHRASELDPSMLEDTTIRSVLMRSIVIPHPALIPSPEELVATQRPVAPDDVLIRSVAELRSGELPRVIQTAATLDSGNWELAPLLINLLAWDEAMPAARSALERMGPKITGMLVDVLLNPDSDFTIRRRVPRVLAFVPTMRSAEGLFTALEDQRFEVRFYSGRALYLLLSDHADLKIETGRIWAEIHRELSLHGSMSQNRRLFDSRHSSEVQWYFDRELLDRADRNLEHLFTLLALLLPVDAVRIAFRALHTSDRQLRGTAFEYLESATPAHISHLLLPLLEAGAENRARSTTADGAMANLLATRALVNKNLNLHAIETRR